MTQPTREQLEQLARERATELAEQDIPAIESLLDSKGWAYFSRRLNERRQAIRDQLADDNALTGRQTRALRAIVKEYDEILRLPHQDRTVHNDTLRAQQRVGPARG